MAESNVVIPYGVGSQFESLSILYFPLEEVFDFIFWAGNRPFLTPDFFNVTDGGWWCWWMVDGFEKGSLIFLKILSDEVQSI